MYLLNAFSLNMIAEDNQVEVTFLKYAAHSAAFELGVSEVINAIGHADTDAVIRNILENSHKDLNLSLPIGERKTVVLRPGDEAIVAQYSGPRLPEGATTLPEDAKIQFWLVLVKEPTI